MSLNVIETPEGNYYELRHGPALHRFHMPPVAPETLDPVVSAQFDMTLGHLTDLSAKKLEVLNNTSLSDRGKAERLDPLQSEALRNIARNQAALEEAESSADAAEATLLAPPVIESTDSVQAIEDGEIRSWWRSRSAQEQSKLIDQVSKDPKSNQRLLIALLRDPLPGTDWQGKVFRGTWATIKRAEAPEKFAAIDKTRASVEWVSRGVAQAAATALSMIGWERGKVLSALASSADGDKALAGVRAYGFGRDDVTAARAMAKHRTPA